MIAAIRYLLVFTSLFLTFSAFAGSTAFDFELSKERCSKPTAEEPAVYSSDFHWSFTPKEMALKFTEIYESGKRLPERVYYDAQEKAFVFPNKTYKGELKIIRVTPEFLKSVTRHVETALEKGYAEQVFFPDMGHSHLYIPQGIWDAEFSDVPMDQKDKLYEKMFAEPTLLTLYHTAEQLGTTDENKQILPDEHLKFRHLNRNPVGDNLGNGIVRMPTLLEDPANTVRELPGFKRWSGGYNISASKDGCFAYSHKGKVMYFDLSLEDLKSAPGGSDYGSY
ncbi:MAG: hypothetical protein CL676_00155 [Bdellovibrionaceae bacterium]|nr:hypothetical protein [Pseudobdellovibrionaceae bacterium]|tara:strand:- start:59 stop:898 length:840 start_codon:yes stop_codon:yes gene_type:complete